MKPVIVYISPDCAYCRIAKDFLYRRNVPFVEYNVMKDEEMRVRMASVSGQWGVPVIAVGEEIFVGFNRAELERALGEE